MDQELLKARLNLLLVIPSLEYIVAGDPEASAIVRKWNCVIQLQAGADGPAVQLHFTNGSLTSHPGRDLKATIILDFGTPQNLNANFGSPGEKQKPKILRGKWHIPLLLKFVKLLVFIKKYLSPRDEEAMTEAQNAVRTSILFNMSVLGIPEIAEYDASVKPVLGNIPNGSCQWKIMPDGPTAHVTVDNGSFSASRGEIGNPTAKVEFKDIPSATSVMTGKLKAMNALMSGALSITGQTQIALTLTPLQDRIGKVLKG